MYTYLCKEMINTKFGGGRKQRRSTDGASVILVIESGLWLKSYVRLFRPDHRQLWRLYLVGITEESCPPHTRFGVKPVHYNLWRSCNQGLRPLACDALSHIYGPQHLHSWVLYLRAWAEGFWISAEPSLEGY